MGDNAVKCKITRAKLDKAVDMCAYIEATINRVKVNNPELTRLWPKIPDTKSDIGSKHSDFSHKSLLKSTHASSTGHSTTTAVQYTQLSNHHNGVAGQLPSTPSTSVSVDTLFSVPAVSTYHKAHSGSQSSPPSTPGKKRKAKGPSSMPKSKILKCDLCDYKTHADSRLQNHVGKHLGTYRLKASKFDLKEEDRHYCKYCNYFDISAFRVKQHLQRKHKEIKLLTNGTHDFKKHDPKQLTSPEYTGHDIEESNHFRCLCCEFSTICKTDMPKHYASHAKQVTERGTAYYCLVKDCFHRATSVHVFIRHLKMKHENYAQLIATDLKDDFQVLTSSPYKPSSPRKPSKKHKMNGHSSRNGTKNLCTNGKL